MKEMQYNLLFCWFVGLGIDDPVWGPRLFTKNRDQLLTTDMSRKFLAAVPAHRDVAPLSPDEVKAWASMKSFQPRPHDDGSPDDPPGAAPDQRADQPAPETAPQIPDQPAQKTLKAPRALTRPAERSEG